MASLNKLGIERSYEPSNPYEIKYSISVDSTRLKSPDQTRKYLESVVDVVSRDAARLGGLDILSITIDDENFLEPLKSVAKDLSSKAKDQKEYIKDPKEWSGFCRFLVYGGVITGGSFGLVSGYDQMSEWATDLADYINNTSHLWAPVSGLLQAGISIIGTAVTTALGAIGGSVCGAITAAPYAALKNPLANKALRYQRLEEALSKIETHSKEND